LNIFQREQAGASESLRVDSRSQPVLDLALDSFHDVLTEGGRRDAPPNLELNDHVTGLGFGVQVPTKIYFGHFADLHAPQPNRPPNGKAVHVPADIGLDQDRPLEITHRAKGEKPRA